MICGRDFLVLSDDWNGFPTSSIHLFRRIARNNRVLWFNTVGRLPRFNRLDVQKVLRTASGWLNPNKPNSAAEGKVSTGPAPGNLHLANPFMIPWFKRPVRRINRISLLNCYRRLAASHGIKEPIVVTTFPYAVDFMKAVDGTRIYYCVDEFLELPGVNRADWAVMEAELLEAIDGLVVTCTVLARKQIRPGPLLHLPHGVELEHFHQAKQRFPQIPRMEAIRRPIVGFFGLIREWVDLEVIAALAQRFPEVSFVLIGRSEIGLDPIEGHPNVHWLGPVLYADLPGYARYFDVGFIPFVLNELTKAVNPLKLMEYLRLGYRYFRPDFQS